MSYFLPSAAVCGLLLTDSLAFAQNQLPSGKEWVVGDGPAYVAFSLDGKTLTAAADRQIALWGAASGKLHRTLARDGRIARSIVLSPDGHTLTTGSPTPTMTPSAAR
jgi:WD40 repeat protein